MVVMLKNGEARRRIITELKAKYLVNELCKYLGMGRSMYYYSPIMPKTDEALRRTIKAVFEQNKCVYGLKKLNKAMHKEKYPSEKRSFLES